VVSQHSALTASEQGVNIDAVVDMENPERDYCGREARRYI